MARSIADIQAQIIAEKEAEALLLGLNSPSKTAIWRLFVYIIASAHWVLEKLFDTHKAEVSEMINNLKPHSLRWYALKSKAFRYGQVLILDTDQYSNIGLTEAQIEAVQVVKEASASQQTGSDELLIKVATRNSAGQTVALSPPQYAAFVVYVSEVKDAGVGVQVITSQGDKLKLNFDVYYDPLILNQTGQRLDGSNTEPVQKVVKLFVQTMPFNGVFDATALTDTLQTVEGVKAPVLKAALAAKFDSTTFRLFDNYYQPYAGYFDVTALELSLNFRYDTD
jgi:hypothetical protein